MGVLRTALAVGAFAMSVPLLAQESRYGRDRGRSDQGESRVKGRSGNPGGTRGDDRLDRGGTRVTTRGEVPSVDRPRADRPRADRPGVNRPGEDRPGLDRSRVDAPRVEVRTSVIPRRDRWDPRDERRDRWDPRDGRRDDRRLAPYGYRVVYRYGDRDFRQRDLFTISAWFRSIGPVRLSAYGIHDRGWDGDRRLFRPGLSLSMELLTRLHALPYDLEFELGVLPWYLERRLYGRTVLVIDVRTRVIVDMYDIDY